MLVFCCLWSILVYLYMRKFGTFKMPKITLSMSSIGKIDNMSIRQNLTYFSDFTRWSRVYTPNMVGIREIDENFQAGIGTSYQSRNKHNVQSQIILPCNLNIFSTCKHFYFHSIHLTPCHFLMFYSY